MKVLKYLQNPSDLPWIIISQLILALAVAHFGVAIQDNAESREIEISQEEAGAGSGEIYIIRMGDTPDQCVVSSADGSVLAQMSTNELDFASLDGRPVVDLSLPEDKRRFFAAISQKLQANGMSIGIAYSK
jgi:hypothetical protein